jgi:16S rRNA (guanine527-N7)-methyltransferase
MTPDLIIESAQAMGVRLDRVQAERFIRFRDLLVEWNKRFNLTALTDDASILSLHFLDSLSALPSIQAWRESKQASHRPISLIDVGTGGGFPGIPLKIAQPDLRVTLLDGTAKKVAFCDEVIRTLDLKDAHAVHGRAEELAHQPAHREKYDVVIARAVAPLPALVEYLLPLASVGGLCIAMKGSDALVEAQQAAGALAKLGGRLDRVVNVHLPNRPGKPAPDQRALILIDKIAESAKKYPRSGGAPRKSPLN